MNKPAVQFRPVAPDYLLFIKIYKEKIDPIENNIAFLDFYLNFNYPHKIIVLLKNI
jgi:hypothetical protein